MLSREEFYSVKVGDRVIDSNGDGGIVVDIGQILKGGPVFVGFSKTGDWDQSYQMISFGGRNQWLVEWYPDTKLLAGSIDAMIKL